MVHLVLEFLILPYTVVDLECPWEEVRSGSSYTTERPTVSLSLCTRKLIKCFFSLPGSVGALITYCT